jgi:hypothetical protein
MLRTPVAVLSLVLLSCSSIAPLASEADLPLRKAGKWSQKTMMDEAGQKREQTLTICIDADMERNTAAASASEHKTYCSKYDVKQDGARYVIEANCKMNNRDVESRTEMSGDFQKTFTVKITSTTSGIQDSQSIAIPRVIEQQGTYLGESCGDLKAGEAMGTDGTRLMVQ